MTLRSQNRIGKQVRAPRVTACSNCRTRKTKCDGGQPGCKTCEVYKDVCRYDKPPAMSTVQAMSRKLVEYEQRINELEEGQQHIPPSLHLASSPSPPPASSTAPTGPSSEPLTFPAQTPGTQSEASSASLPPDVTMDENGQLCYHGPTSALHDPGRVVLVEHGHVHSHMPQSDRETRSQLAATAIESRAWEEFALDNAAMRTNIPKSVMSELLRMHWSWIAPMFMWVYRPAFMRDMSTGGKYCSEFLLTTLCAHSARYSHDQTGEALIARVRLLLGQEIQSPSSISSAQALLQLSARDLAFGAISQAWLYSGMAFRMVSDLGLHHSGSGLDPAGGKAEDREIRRRLFWSCYFWDKAISLYLGRMPILRELPSDDRPILLDDSAENEFWVPYYGSAATQGPLSPASYPPLRAHSISCFENSCKLAVIISDIIEQLYSRRALPSTGSSMRGIAERLSAWRLATPSHLRYCTDDLPPICGPPHILTQNLLYHTSLILLHRPFSASSGHHTACRTAADAIGALLKHYEGTFGFTRITYLMAYCVYLGASVIAQDVKQDDAIAKSKIETFLRALEGSRRTCPSIQRSIDIIRNSLAKPTSESVERRQDPEERLYDFLPAFPHCESHILEPDSTFDTTFDLDDLSILDGFPEAHLDFSGTDWYVPI